MPRFERADTAGPDTPFVVVRRPHSSLAGLPREPTRARACVDALHQRNLECVAERVGGDDTYDACWERIVVGPPSARCPEVDLTSAGLGRIFAGTTQLRGNDADPPASCFASDDDAAWAPGAPDVSMSWVAPDTARYVFDTLGSDINTVLSIRSSCQSEDLACGGPSVATETVSASRIVLDAVGGQEYIIIVDGFGPYNYGGAVVNVARE